MEAEAEEEEGEKQKKKGARKSQMPWRVREGRGMEKKERDTQAPPCRCLKGRKKMRSMKSFP